MAEIDDREFRYRIKLIPNSDPNDPRFIEGEINFPAPWQVNSVTDQYGRVYWMVLAANGRTIINVDVQHTESFCRSIAKARNDDTDEQCLSAMHARMNLGISNAFAEVDRVRAHFQAENGRLVDEVYRLQDQVDELKRAGLKTVSPEKVTAKITTRAVLSVGSTGTGTLFDMIEDRS